MHIDWIANESCHRRGRALRTRCTLLPMLLFVFCAGRAGAQSVCWNERAVLGPEARYDHAMAYDPVRNVTVLFGGQIRESVSLDTWEWDGASWNRHISPEQEELDGMCMCFDSVNNKVIRVGGATAGFY